MKINKHKTVVCMLVLCCVAWVSAYGGDSEIKGMIIDRGGDSMTVRTMDGITHPVILTDETKVQAPKGLGLRKSKMSWADLIPGLRVSVKGDTNNQGQVVASVVSFSKDDLRTASMIQAGLNPTAERVSTNEQNIATNKQGVAANQRQIEANEQAVNQRFSSLADYDTKNQMTVYFAPGKSNISAEDKQALSQLAAGANGLPGSVIQVKGFADSSGNAAMNQTLSKNRAEAVVAYLMQDGEVPPRHIVAPGAMGISDPVASNETSQGRSQNRRVEVTVLVNKGVSGTAASK
jgi:outer membrane protein OmpA-like peptidoglycan-associated protein